MPKITIVRYEYHEGDGHFVQIFLDGVATWAGNDQDNGRVQYPKILGALIAADVEEIDIEDDISTHGLTSDLDPEWYGFDAYDDGVTYTGKNLRD